MIRFCKLNPDGTETDVRFIPQSVMLKCPHCIMVPEHYREDHSCKCDDPNEKIMREWGYRWSKSKNRWV